MKKILLLLCLFTIVSCNKDNLEEVHQETLDNQITNLQLEQMISGKRSPSAVAPACSVDPDDFEECEVTFKVLCVDDCGMNLIENGEVWLNFEYHRYHPSTSSNTAFVQNTWGSVAGGGANLQIGEEYTLPNPVLISEDCPIKIWGELWSCCFACLDPCSIQELELVGGTIYLEINNEIYYPLQVWNIPQCSTLPALDPWSDSIRHEMIETLDENCSLSGRVDYVQDPCEAAGL